MWQPKVELKLKTMKNNKNKNDKYVDSKMLYDFGFDSLWMLKKGFNDWFL